MALIYADDEREGGSDTSNVLDAYFTSVIRHFDWRMIDIVVGVGLLTQHAEHLYR